jgi:hypothetical protein
MFRRYNKIVLIGGFFSSIIFFTYAAWNGNLYSNFWIFRCSTEFYSNEFYLSYCNDQAFADYEHGALHSYDKESIVNLKKSRVLFLGNSKAQKAFSANALYQYFNRRKISYFNLAMGYGEMDIFPQFLINHHGLKPDIIVINADYFFYNAASQVAKDVITMLPQIAFEYRMKRWIQPLHQKICGSETSEFKDILCGNISTQFKSRINGRIQTANHPVSQAIPVTHGAPIPEKLMKKYIANALRFRNKTIKHGACMVLTVVPHSDTSPEVAQRISAALGLPVVIPPQMDLLTYDGNHLEQKSVEKWATTFLVKFDQILQKCLNSNTARKQ